MRKSALFLLTVLSLLLQNCTISPGSRSKSFKVAVIQYQHETCTFCPGGDTQIDDWTRERPYVDGEELLGTGGYIAGFVHTAGMFDNVELVGIKSPDYVYGGSSRS